MYGTHHKKSYPIMARRRKRGGIGATGSAFAKFFHPSQGIRTFWQNDWQRHRCTGVEIIGKSMRQISRRQQLAYECRIPEINDEDIWYIVCSNFKVEEEGPTPFPDEDETPPPPPPPSGPADVTDDDRSSSVNVTSNIDGDVEITDMVAGGITVDNEGPAPENAVPPPIPTGPVGRWEKPLICPRRASLAVRDMVGQWKLKTWPQIASMSEFSIFRLTFPESFIKDVVIPSTNVHLDEKLTLPEFYVWLGCRFFMACFEGVSRLKDWWSSDPVSMWEGAPFRLNDFIDGQRFLDINQALRYTDKPPPTFLDRFYEMRQLQDAFNSHYEENYSPSWISCLDESMNSWHNKFCPGFMVVPRKPHPFGNEYHTIADGDQGKPIMWRAKIQEGKDRPMEGRSTPRYPSPFECYSVTAKLMLEMVQPIFNSGRVVTMDSGFCVTAGILAMHDHGVYGQALIKKRGRYWPRHVPGDAIEEHFAEKEIGDVDCLKQTIDGKDFFVHCTKDDGYVTKIMSTHGLLAEVPDHRTRRVVNGEVKTFNYIEPLSRHNRAKHWVDDVNNRRHDPISLESSWATKFWPHRQFTFFVSIAEVNANNSQARAKSKPAQPTLEFRKKLAMQMMNNKLDSDGRVVPSPMRPQKRSRLSIEMEHGFEQRPNFTGAWDRIERKFATTTTKHCKTKCANCPNKVRTYCRCNKAVTLCTDCWGAHCIDVGMKKALETN